MAAVRLLSERLMRSKRSCRSAAGKMAAAVHGQILNSMETKERKNIDQVCLLQEQN